MGIRRFLKPFEKTIIDLYPSQACSFEFTCGMSMLRGRIALNCAATSGATIGDKWQANSTP